MTESIARITDLSAIAGDGTGSARNRAKSKRPRREGEHDSVFISDEARRRSATEEDDYPRSEE